MSRGVPALRATTGGSARKRGSDSRPRTRRAGLRRRGGGDGRLGGGGPEPCDHR
jgi:hypothetical protein